MTVLPTKVRKNFFGWGGFTTGRSGYLKPEYFFLGLMFFNITTLYILQASQWEIPFQVILFQAIFAQFQVIFRIFQVTLPEICDIWGLHCGVNSTVFMNLHSAKEIIEMSQILCQRIFTCEEKKKLILPRSGGDLRKWYP